MKIGYSVEDATSRAFLTGLCTRWCPEAELVEGPFRGSTGVSLRREIPRICQSLDHKGCTVVVILTDSNRREWRHVMNEQQAKVPEDFLHRCISGVCERNIECWLCADADWIANRTGQASNQFRAHDPKGIFENAMAISSHNRQEENITRLVMEAPLDRWLEESRSFAQFYEDARQTAKSMPCDIPNERQR